MKAVSLIVLVFALHFMSGGAGYSQGSGLDYLRGGSKLSEEPGALYVEDILDRPIELRALRDAPIYYQLDLGRFLGTMKAGTPVRVVALTEHAYKVRGAATHGEVSGWMRITDLMALDPKFVENIKKLYERQKLVADLIANKQVALGMKLDEVRAALGNPNEKSSRLDGAGRTDVYDYVSYSYIPQLQTVRGVDGQLYNRMVSTRVVSSRLSVSFKDELVVSVEEKETTAPARPALVVPPPVVFF